MGCGLAQDDPRAWAQRREISRRSVVLTVVALGLLAALAIGYADRYLPVVSDWYTEAVIRYHLPPVTHLVAAVDERSAFYFCARSVVRRIDEASSIALFDRRLPGDAVMTRPGRYEVSAYVEESRADGSIRRLAFTCRAHYNGRGWVLDDLRLGAADPPGSIARLGDRLTRAAAER